MRKRDVASIIAALDLPGRIKALDTSTENTLLRDELTPEGALRAWARRSTYLEVARLLARIEQEAE